MKQHAGWICPQTRQLHYAVNISVPVKSTEHEKSYFTVILTSHANGTKMKPCCIQSERYKLVKELEQIPGIVVRFNTNGWMNDVLTIDYLCNIVGTFSFNKRLLVWECIPLPHQCSSLGQNSTLTSPYIPGGCTKFIQAADIVWIVCFKSNLQNLYDAWIADSAGHLYTKGATLKPHLAPCYVSG